MKTCIVTTSWDDGHILDVRLVELLKKYHLPATFYIAPDCREITPDKRLSRQAIVDIAKDFEIGSHTMTHPVLTKISNTELEYEIYESKRYLEDLVGKKVTTFCYPRGICNERAVQAVRRAGYRYARTVEEYVFELGDTIKAGTSTETHRLPIPRLPIALVRLARFCNWNPVKIIRTLSWEKRAMMMFDMVHKNGGVFHLWGHSWAIENEAAWDKVDRVMNYIHGHDDVQYVTNGELVTGDSKL